MIDAAQTYIPTMATPAEAAVMRSWLRQNELCRGDPRATPKAPACRSRDDLERRARAAGWCWSFRDYRIMPVDYHWHRCDGERQSAALQAYKTATFSLNYRAAALNAALKCQLLSASAYAYLARENERKRMGLVAGRLFTRLSRAEQRQAFAWDSALVRDRERRLIGDGPQPERCARFANSAEGKQFVGL